MIPVVLGTRGSPLALAQTRLVLAELKRAWPTRTFEIYTIRTQGDRFSENPAAGATTGKGIFTGELESALHDRRIHIAVHSLKDLPTEDSPGLVVASIPIRADARDVLITRGPAALEELPAGARIATGSVRRSAQLKLFRPDVEIVDIRGNIDTRLRKFRENADWSALVLAAAGLNRLQPDLAGLTVTPMPLEIMLPAPGQGALGLQTRADDADVIALVQAVHDPVSAAAVKAERMLLQALGGGCEEPIAAFAQPEGEAALRLDAVAWLFGEAEVRRGYLIRKIGDAERLGVDLAVELSR
jgi:hydroxymethylbilane synthase